MASGPRPGPSHAGLAVDLIPYEASLLGGASSIELIRHVSSLNGGTAFPIYAPLYTRSCGLMRAGSRSDFPRGTSTVSPKLHRLPQSVMRSTGLAACRWSRSTRTNVGGASVSLSAELG